MKAINKAIYHSILSEKRVVHPPINNIVKLAIESLKVVRQLASEIISISRDPNKNILSEIN